MNFKKMITLIEFLALTGVMSVGFSTWVIVETNFPEIKLQVETENVFNTNEYLTIKNYAFSDIYYELNEDGSIKKSGFFKDFVYDVSVAESNYVCQFVAEVEVNLNVTTSFIKNNMYSFIFSLSCTSNNTAPTNFVAKSNNIDLVTTNSFDIQSTNSKLNDPNSENKFSREDSVLLNLNNVDLTNKKFSLYLTYNLEIEQTNLNSYIINYLLKGKAGIPFKLTASLLEGKES